MRTRYGVSPWIHGFPASRRPDYPRLRGEHAADVVIIGGGLTGCATAYACGVAGLKAIVIEAARLAQGSAGHGAGLLLPEPGPGFRDVAQAYGVRAARHAFDAWRRGSLDAAALLRRLGMKRGLDRCDNVVVTLEPGAKALRREHQARKDAGLDVTWLTEKQITQATALDGTGGLRMHDAFALDPYRSAVTLAAAARRRGVALFERSPVLKVRVGKNDVEVVVDGGVVRARTVIVTTGTATPVFKPLQRHFTRRETYLVLTEPLPAAMRKEVPRADLTFCDTRSPRHRIRWTRDGRLLVGGADQDETAAGRRAAVLLQRTGQLMYELLTMYPAIAGLRPEYGWHLPYGETADGLMYIGPHRNYPRHLFALGHGGDSVTGGFLAARILVRAVRGESEKQDAVFGFTR